MSNKVIARIMGGLGNQLFCYAAARRLALVNNAELVQDNETGFTRDYHYRREYSLTGFPVAGRFATNAEKFKPLERVRRKLTRKLSHRQAFEKRAYIDQCGGQDFDPRLLNREVQGCVWLDGYWQSEGYFADIADTIRADLAIAPSSDPTDMAITQKMAISNAVAVHLRWFDDPSTDSRHNASPDYYWRAFNCAAERLENPHFFVFSDKPDAARAALALDPCNVTFVTHNSTARDGALADFRLMRQAKHFIIANSTFSWWAAWLGAEADKLVIAPSTETVVAPSWTIKGLVPDRWHKI